jgi:DNA invertase Pin-like site-specific DNA recombinase
VTRSQTARRAIGYVRVSTDQQAESGLGLDAQEAAIAAAASRLGLDLVRLFTDAGVSGKLAIEDRPVLLDAVGTLRRGDVLLIAKRDRLGRDVIAVALIERLITKRGARIVSAAGEGTESDDPSAMLMRRLIDSFAEYERLIIGARTRAALSAKRRRGERISRFAPFGSAFGPDGGTLVPAVDEQRLLAAMRQRRAAGDSLQAIADGLNDSGERTRAGSRWRFEYVRSALRQLP